MRNFVRGDLLVLFIFLGHISLFGTVEMVVMEWRLMSLAARVVVA